jgi:maltoporin
VGQRCRYWARPELRAFVTHGSWNSAATAAVNAANESGKVYGNATSGTSVGIQVESWF